MNVQKSRKQTASKKMREPTVEYTRSKVLPNFFGQPMLRGAYLQLEDVDPQSPALFYSHPHGEIWMGDAIAWLRTSKSESVDLVFLALAQISRLDHR